MSDKKTYTKEEAAALKYRDLVKMPIEERQEVWKIVNGDEPLLDDETLQKIKNLGEFNDKWRKAHPGVEVHTA